MLDWNTNACPVIGSQPKKPGKLHYSCSVAWAQALLAICALSADMLYWLVKARAPLVAPRQ